MSVCHLASHCTDAKKVSYPFCYVDNEGTVIGLGLLANRKNTEQGARLACFLHHSTSLSFAPGADLGC